MHPIFFHLGPLTLYAYGALVALGFLVGSIWVARRAQRAGEDVDTYLQSIFWIIIAGFTGARLLYVIYYPDAYLADPLRMVLDRGGLVWYGGLVSAVLASLVFVKIKRLSLPKFADILSAPAAIGLAIGRVGCFMTGCCYGKPTHLPWAVQFPPGHETHPLHVHPTQLYESLGLLVLIILLQWAYKHSKTPGLTACLFFVGYGILRFLIEYLRGDVVFWVAHVLTASQVFSLVGIFLGLGLMLMLRRKPNLPSLGLPEHRSA